MTLHSTEPAIVSVSRSAGPPHFGQVVFTKLGMSASGDLPVPVGL